MNVADEYGRYPATLVNQASTDEPDLRKPISGFNTWSGESEPAMMRRTTTTATMTPIARNFFIKRPTPKPIKRGRKNSTTKVAEPKSGAKIAANGGT